MEERASVSGLWSWLALIWWEHVPHEHKPGVEGWKWICQRCLRDMPKTEIDTE